MEARRELMPAGSTSWHTLSADRRLSRPERLFWIALNLLNNAFPRLGVDGRINERRFRLSAERLDELWNGIARDASPSRRLSDLFWLSLPWTALVQQMGRVRALEMGCGSGAYGRLLERILDDDLESYAGVDIAEHEEWRRNRGARHSFAVGSAANLGLFLADANLVMTQSALEHFEQDLQYFTHVARHVRASTNPVLQVHLMPTASCITTFPWHGVREYTPRTISKITRLFGEETTAYLFALGGPRCNRIHREFITRPRLLQGKDLRQPRLQEYLPRLRSAMLADFDSRTRTAAFYALVLATHFPEDPFRQCAA